MMKSRVIVPASIVLAMLFFWHGCSTNEELPPQETTVTTESSAGPRVVKGRPAREIPLAPSALADSLGITAANYPYIDGSTSTLGLVQALYSHMFLPGDEPDDEGVLVDGGERLLLGAMGYKGIPRKASQTVVSYEKLIAGEVDVIFVPDPSGDVKQQAEAAGVELEYIPIGAEALVFITSGKNSVGSVGIAQLRWIYSDMSMTDWLALGGRPGRIVAYSRNKDSGSHAQMENLVLRGKQMHPAISGEGRLISSMSKMVARVETHIALTQDDHTDHALGYTMYYYLQQEQQARKQAGGEPLALKMLAIDGIAPTPETIHSKQYTLTVSYFAVIRKDEPADSPTRKIVEWLLTDDGQRVVTESGLGAIKPVADQ
jgi:phosphate transport system substrate-binding protein